jgi:hypothetical protein
MAVGDCWLWEPVPKTMMSDTMILTPDLLRLVVIDCLKNPRRLGQDNALRTDYLLYEVAEIAKNRGLKFNENINAWLMENNMVRLYPNLRAAVSSVIWDLIIEGVLRPGNGPNPDLPHIQVTEFGKMVFQGQVTLYDPTGYLKHLHQKVPTIDPVIVQYIAESAETLHRNCLLSSTVMLGCASEQAFLLLLEAYQDALNSTDQAAFINGIEKQRTIKLKHIEFMKWYENKLKPKIKPPVFSSDGITELETALTFVFGYFRTNRNDAGHPSDAKFSREISAQHLVMFPLFVRAMYDLIDWLGANKPI